MSQPETYTLQDPANTFWIGSNLWESLPPEVQNALKLVVDAMKGLGYTFDEPGPTGLNPPFSCPMVFEGGGTTTSS